MNLKNAFTYMFKDNNFLPKYIIGVLLMIPSSISSIFYSKNPILKIIPFIKDIDSVNLHYIYTALCVIGAITAFIIYGYNLINVNTRIYKTESRLPAWCNIKNIVLTALKLFAISFACVIVLSLAISFFTIVYMLISQLLVHSIIGNILSILLLIVLLIAGIIILLLIPAAIISFATNLKISSFFNIKFIFNMIKENKLKYFICLIFYAVFLLPSFGLAMFAYTKFYPLILLAPFVCFYTDLVFAEIQASVPRPDEQISEMHTEQE